LSHTDPVQLNVWHHVVIRCEIEDNATAGATLEIYLDGQKVVFSSSAFLLTIDDDPITDFRFGPRADIGTFDLDDVWLLDETDGVAPTSSIGDVVVATIYPDGDGNTIAWTPLAGTRWESVDEGAGVDHDGNATYVSSQTAGQQNLFTFGSVPAAVDSVGGALAINYVSSKEAALGGPGFHAVKRTSTTTVVDDTFVMQSGQSGYTTSQKIWNTDGLGAAWTESTINSSEFGMEVED
jgi:hypothetical protein